MIRLFYVMFLQRTLHGNFLCKLHTVEINSYQVESCSETHLVSLRMFFNKVEIILSGSLFQHARILQGFIRPKGSNLCKNGAFCVSMCSVQDLNEVQTMHSQKQGSHYLRVILILYKHFICEKIHIVKSA